MCRVLRLSKNKRERQREFLMKINWKNCTRVSPFVFDSHNTTKENTDDEEETLKEETTLEEGCQNASLFSRISLFLCLLLLLLTTGERDDDEEESKSSSRCCRNDQAKTTFAFESSVAASDDAVDDFASRSSMSRKRKDDENDDDFSPLFELALRCFQTEFPNLVVQQEIRGKEETQKSRCSWETKSEKIGRERVEVTTRTVVLRPKPGANEEELMERVRITFVSGGTIAHCLNVHCTPRRAFHAEFRRGRVELWEREERFSRD